MDFSNAWLVAIGDVRNVGVVVMPRGIPTVEVLHKTIEVDMRRPVLRVDERRVNYRFMAAEAYWILSGDDRVETIAPYNSRISKFSDDGERFFGAYGPKICGQLAYVVDKLTDDPNSRQAGLTIWRESPPETKDVPCTVSIFFSIRGGKLNSHVFMRSNDLWLGTPYDVFNFSMLAHLVCGHLNERNNLFPPVVPGTLFLTAASSHIYMSNFEGVENCLFGGGPRPQPETPELLYRSVGNLMSTLKALRDTKPGHPMRWWEM